MAKSETEIVEAHKTTIEALTGKRCEIRLINREDQILQKKSLAEIETAVEKYNVNFKSIKSKGNYGELVTLRKIFCLFASLNHSQATISKHTGFKLSRVRYYLRCGKTHLKNDPAFVNQFTQIKTDLTKGF